MATTIYSITGVWQNWKPTNVTNPVTNNYLGEARFNWGLPTAGTPLYVGFTGAAPPSKDVDINETFSIGTVTLNNTPSFGINVNTIDLKVTVVFGEATGPTATFTLTFKYELADGVGTLTCTSGLPVTIEDEKNDLKLTISSLSGELTAGPNVKIASDLLVSFQMTPYEDETCASFIAFFDPDGCDVPAVCPIDNVPIIEDCSIPDPIEPIMDCPDISLPITSHNGMSGGGGDGPPGPPGENGAPGCKPVIQTSYSIVWVYDCHTVGVAVEVMECPTTTPEPGGQTECCYELAFTFYLCYNPIYDWGCCPFLWCGGSWIPIDDYNCEGITAPTDPGVEEGQLFYKCYCDSTTSTEEYTTQEKWLCHPSRIKWLVLVCNFNNDVDDVFKVELNDVELTPSVDLGPSCSTFAASTDGTLTPAEVKQMLLDNNLLQPMFPGSAPDNCYCEPGSIDALNPALMQLNNVLKMTKVADNGYGNFGAVFVLGFDRDEDGNVVLCCPALVDYYTSYPEFAVGYSISWPFSTSGCDQVSSSV